jgi:hypothetical protein
MWLSFESDNIRKEQRQNKMHITIPVQIKKNLALSKADVISEQNVENPFKNMQPYFNTWGMEIHVYIFHPDYKFNSYSSANIPFLFLFPLLLNQQAQFEEVKAFEVWLEEESLSQMIGHLMLHAQKLSSIAVKISWNSVNMAN